MHTIMNDLPKERDERFDSTARISLRCKGSSESHVSSSIVQTSGSTVLGHHLR